MNLSRHDEDRFWSWVDAKPEGCWEWQGHTADGYGRVKIKGKMEGTHRVAYALEFGSIPKGRLICHMCDNRRCVKPGHLFLGTNQDNMADMAKKGRAFRMKGSNHVNHKLTEDQVRTIREAQLPQSYQELADTYGVKKSAIAKIMTRKTWRHI